MNNNFYNSPVVGEVFYVDLNRPGDYTINKVRPCLILWQVSRTYTVIPITKYINVISPSEIFIEKGNGGLKVDSRLKIGQMTTVSEEKILNRMGAVSNEIFKEVKKKINNLLGI